MVCVARQTSPRGLAVKALFALSLLIAGLAAASGFYGPVSEMHGFRQAQTAISAFYLLKGGPWLAYETPVLGPPWSIPFEFPLYQWAVALVAKSGLFPLVQAGRLVSVLFFLSGLVPAYGILRLLRLGRNQALAVLSLYCVSPQYLFWSRALMIESTALSLSLYYIWFVMLYSEGSGSRIGKWVLLGLVAVSGSLAGMVKVTTFTAFLAAGLTMIGFRALKGIKGGHPVFREWRLLLFGVIVPVAAVYLWTSFADSNKALNPFGAHLASSALKKWNFGTITQRLSLSTYKTFLARDLTAILGWNLLLIPATLAGFFCGRERLKTALALSVLFALPFFVFTNLFFVHDYYSYANGLFLTAAAGVACIGLMESGSRLKFMSGIALFSLIYVSSAYGYVARYWPVQGTGYDFSDMKADIQAYTGADDVVVALGFGWSSEIPFYLERRGVILPEWTMQRNSLTAIEKTRHSLAGYRIGAVMFCDSVFSKTMLDEPLQKKVLAGLGFRKDRAERYEFCKVYYLGPDGPEADQ